MKLHAEVLDRKNLTPREAEVFALVCSGLSNKAIAKQLDIHIKVVSKHIDSIYEKLGLRWQSINTRVVAAMLAVESGMVKLAKLCIIGILIVQAAVLDDRTMMRGRTRMPRVRVVRIRRKDD